ncbi:hypothetical protein [Dysgonomonas sp. 25]|uniref:hypothetical protein n=1 Tax=Dysgonomonas sp. 25 TaxID=2302933 RepID=UPI0013D1E543|nr:hypothetical protein [Dysgonomonas sp. 25]NDV69093.1 hypothetical protein [Dysgonomonas sp. 25]
MKTFKLFAFITLSTIISILFIFNQSCSTENEPSSPPKRTIEEKTAFLEKTAIVGKEHNENMDKILESLKDAKYSFNKDNVKDIAYSKTCTVLNIEEESNILKSATNSYTLKDFFSVDKNFGHLFTNNRQKAIEEFHISEELNILVLKLFEVCGQYTLPESEFNSKIKELEEEAFEVLTDNDLIIFLSGTSVACASHKYWSENASLWYQTITGEENITKSTNPYDHWIMDGLVKCDVTGAITGGIAGGLGGILVGGVGAVPGAIGGALIGGCAGSVGAMLDNIWDRYF